MDHIAAPKDSPPLAPASRLLSRSGARPWPGEPGIGGTGEPYNALKRPRMRRARKWALAGAALLLIMGAGVGVDEIFWRGAHAAAVASAVGDAVMDPGSIFAARSPGARDGGPLLQTKLDRVAAAPGVHLEGPEERVLAGVRERLPEPELALDGSPLSLVQAPPGVAFGPRGPGDGFPPPPGVSGPGFSPLTGPLTPPNSQSTPPGGSTPNTPQTPTNPVPEPDTWMLMITALFAVGAALRWKRSHRATPAASPRFNA